ncbi:unnamed protein product [Caenorhabditis brenneri]
MFGNLFQNFQPLRGYTVPQYFPMIPYETPLHTPATPGQEAFIDVEKIDEDVKPILRHRRIHSKNNCLTPPNSDDDVMISQLLIFVLCIVIGDGPGIDSNFILFGLQNLNSL